jgi:MFS family permease
MSLDGASFTAGRQSQLACAWCGYGFAAFFLVGALLVAHWFPPLDPGDSALATATVYREQTSQIRVGLLIVFVGQVMFPFFGGAIAGQTRRIRRAAPALSYTQIASVGCASMAMVGPLATFFVTAYRPERAPEMTQLLNDISWIVFMVAFVPFVPFVSWAVAIGLAILSDTSSDTPDTPIYPRWSGYLSIAVGLIQMPAGLLIFFKAGPFAWNGLFSFWIPAIDFFGWILAMTALTIRAIRQPTHSDTAGALQRA